MKISTAELTQLQATFACGPDELEVKINQLAEAAREEYIKMALGQRVFTRGQDILEYRLLLLIQHVFDNRLPSEQEISNIFQTTISQSRTLMRSVLAKYQYDLQAVTRATLKDVLEASTIDINDDEMHRLTIDNASIVEAFNRWITSIDGSLKVLSKVPGTGSSYVLPASSFDELKKRLA